MEAVQESAANSASGRGSFKKTVSQREVRSRQLYLRKKHVETNIKPTLAANEIDILNKGEGSVPVVAVDVKTGKRFPVNLRSVGYGYLLTGVSDMIKTTKLNADHEIDFCWRDGALHDFND